MGASGHAVTVQDAAGREISTAPMLTPPVLSIVNVKVVPAESLRYWMSGETEAFAEKMGAAETVADVPATRTQALRNARARPTIAARGRLDRLPIHRILDSPLWPADVAGCSYDRSITRPTGKQMSRDIARTGRGTAHSDDRASRSRPAIGICATGLEAPENIEPLTRRRVPSLSPPTPHESPTVLADPCPVRSPI